MGLATLLFLIIAGVIAFPFIRELFDKFTKSQEEKDREAAKQRQREQEGLVTTLTRLFAGDNFVDNQQTKKKVQTFNTNAQKIKQEQARAAGFASIDEFEKATDSNRDATKFNPKGIIGFGIKQFNNGKGLKDTPENRQLLLQFQQKDSVASRRKKLGRQRIG